MSQNKLTLFLILTLSSIISTAQTQTIRFYENVDKIDVSNFIAKNGKTYTNLSFDGAIAVGVPGQPTLPKIRHFIKLPIDATPSILVKNFTMSDITLSKLGASAPLAPYQPSPSKSTPEKDVAFVIDSKAYTMDSFTQPDIATISVIGIMRGIKIAQVEINPVDYNPVSGVVRQFNNIEVEVHYDSPTNDVTMSEHLYSPYFDVVQQLINNNQPSTRSSGDDYSEHPDLTKYPVRMLIVSHRMFEQTLQPFVEWKTQKGFDVEVAYTDEIGSSSYDIKYFIHNRYHNAAYEGKSAPTFLVLVGDVDQVPASNTYEWTSDEYFQSDFDYANMEKISVDRFPDMYHGRLSAETTDELKAIIDKIIYYEKYQFEDPSYLGRATLIAGADPGGLHASHAEPKMKYLVANYLNSEGGFNTVYEYGVNDENNPLSRDDYSGCYDSERLKVGFINYSAHADQYRWGDPRFERATLYSTNNENKYPFVIGNCCLSSDFGFYRAPCIGEEWLRKPNGGAVTYIGSSPTSAWHEDCIWTMGMKNNSNDGYTADNTSMGAYDAPFISDYVCTAGIMFVGNLAVTKGSIIGMIEKYWTGYNVLGDPSLIPYWGEAETINATFKESIPPGATSFSVEAPKRSLVALSCSGTLLSSTLVGESGIVELSFDEVETNNDLTLVITKPQHKPVIATIAVSTSSVDEIIASPLTSTIDIYNTQGILLRSTTNDDDEHATDGLAPGVYIKVTTSQQDQSTTKIVVR